MRRQFTSVTHAHANIDKTELNYVKVHTRVPTRRVGRAASCAGATAFNEMHEERKDLTVYFRS